ncbi:hypothetical protein CASFOL_015672 [Castilleja foliolosa]|uniref:CCHC-type domain-containing protein n=1 Tax=Castilleja foliolosa TaxID=1961234 RepID=A0ABD3DI32_9LAMI
MLYGKETLTMTEVKSVLNSKEIQKKSEFKSENSNEVLFVQRGRSEEKDAGRRNFKSRSRGPSQRKCWYCKKEGHIRKFCPEREKSNSDRKSDFGDASVASEGYDSADVLTVTDSKGREDWVLDSGATFHMCPNKKLFEELIESDGGKVVLGNDGVCTIKGTGSIRFKLCSGEERILTSVCYVPDLRRNLISVGMLDDLGFEIKASQGRIKILKGSMIILRGIKKNGIYILEGNAIVGSMNVAKTDVTKLWHLRLGHISEEGLQDLPLNKDCSKEKRIVEPTQRFGYADLIAYALSVSQVDSIIEPESYDEAIHSKDRSIMYAMVCTRPDLAFSLSILSRFMGNPNKSHWHAAKWLMRYIKGSLKLSLCYTKTEGSGNWIKGFVDSDYAGCAESRKSTTGYVFTCLGGAISWKARLQKVVALSSTEAEFIAATEAVKEAMWFKGVIKELLNRNDVITVYCDNQSALHLSKNPMFHERSKHIDVRLHFIRDVIERKEVHMEKVGTEDNPADMLTKVLPMSKFRYCLKLIQVEEKGAHAPCV